MIESTPEQRTVIIRLSDKTSRGHQFVQLADGVSVVYNKRTPISIITAMGEYADQHNGKVLVPFNGYISLKNVLFCRHFVVMRSSGEYITGDIVNAGEKYRRGVTDTSEYRTPPEWMAKTAKFWIQAENVQHGDHFDPTPYVLDDFRRSGETKPLAETMKANAHCAAMIAYNLDIKGDDFYE